MLKKRIGAKNRPTRYERHATEMKHSTKDVLIKIIQLALVSITESQFHLGSGLKFKSDGELFLCEFECDDTQLIKEIYDGNQIINFDKAASFFSIQTRQILDRDFRTINWRGEGDMNVTENNFSSRLS